MMKDLVHYVSPSAHCCSEKKSLPKNDRSNFLFSRIDVEYEMSMLMRVARYIFLIIFYTL